MTSTTDLTRLRDAVQHHARPLTSLEEATDAELSVLDDVIGDARVVALGEGVHFAAEFGQAWRRLVRYLSERHGFTVIAAEFGFHEARALDAWARGHGSDADLATLPGTTNAGVDGVMARWLRQHNATSAHPLQLVGLDTPVAGGDLALVLDALAEVVQDADPDALPLVRAAADSARRFTSPSRAGSAPLRAQLPAADLDHLSATLARLALRMDSLRTVYVTRVGAERADLARRLLAVATTADADVAATQDALFGDGGLPLEGSLRDRLMADCLHWHLQRLSSSDRVVLLAHNSHVQKVPVSWPGYGLAALTLGSYLAEELGGEYRAIALTHQSRRVPEITPVVGAPEGFEVEEVDLDTPPATGVEALLEAAGTAGRPVVLPLARVVADAGVAPSAIGAQSTWMPMDVGAAFDAVVSVPTVTVRTERRLR